MPVDRQQIGQRITCSNCLEEFVAQPTENVEPGGRRGLAETTDFMPLAETTEFTGLPPSVESLPQPATIKIHRLLNRTQNTSSTWSAHSAVLDRTPRDEQIGQTLRCPDCDFLITVQKPPRPARRLPGQRTAADEEIRLTDVSAGQASSFAGARVPPEGRVGGCGQATRSARAGFHRARHVAAVSERNSRTTFRCSHRCRREPLRSRLLRFLREPATLIRSLILAIGLLIELAAIRTGRPNCFSAIPTSSFCVSCCWLSLPYLVFALFVIASITLLAVLQDTAVGKDVIESWPEGNFLDWFADGALPGGGVVYRRTARRAGRPPRGLPAPGHGLRSSCRSLLCFPTVFLLCSRFCSCPRWKRVLR